MKYEVIFQEREDLEPGSIVQATFTANDLTEAVRKLCDNTTSCVESDEIEDEEDFDEDDSPQFTAEEALDEIVEGNDEDHDIILSFRNLTTGEIHIHQDQFERQDWD